MDASEILLEPSQLERHLQNGARILQMTRRVDRKLQGFHDAGTGYYEQGLIEPGFEAAELHKGYRRFATAILAQAMLFRRPGSSGACAVAGFAWASAA